MNENFRKFKKRVWLFILIKCLLAGFAAAAIAVNAVFVPCRLCGVNLFWVYYLLIGVGAFATGGGVAFIFLRTDDRKIAKLLDSELILQERGQTAYEFRKETGEVYELQRTNAGSALNGVKLSLLPFKNIVLTVLCAAVIVCGAAAVPVVAAVVPVAETGTGKPLPPVEPPRDLTDWEWAALDDLIYYVRTSRKADTAAKTGMLYELEGLKTVLQTGVSQSSLTAFVENTVTNIRNAVKDANEADGITEEQKTLNSEEEVYVINRLYEIFSLNKPGGNDGETENPGGNPDDGEIEDPDINKGNGGLDLNDTPFYDPVKGYIKVGEAINDGYYERVQAALADGTISEEEWAEIMIAYFAQLNANKNN